MSADREATKDAPLALWCPVCGRRMAVDVVERLGKVAVCRANDGHDYDVYEQWYRLPVKEGA